MMDNSGFIVLHRKILDWRWYDDANTFRLFLHLLLHANFKDVPYHNDIIKRGQLRASLSELSKELKIPIRQLRTAINHLKTTGEVTSKNCLQSTIYTVVKYDEYQSNDKESDKQMTKKRQAVDKKVTNKRQVSDKPTIYNKENKDNKETKITNILPAKPEALHVAYLDFIEMRKKIKKPMTDRAIQMLVKKVQGLSNDELTQIAILNQSTLHCWQSVYPLKNSIYSLEEENNNAGNKQCDKQSEYHNEWNGTVL